MSAARNKTDVDLTLINGEEVNDGGGVPYGLQLMKFGESLASGDEAALAGSRQRLFDAAGPAVLVDAAAVAANFQRMVRLADAAAIPVDNVTVAISANVRKKLDLGRLHTSQNTPPPTFMQRLQGVFIRAVAPFLMRRMAKKSNDQDPATGVSKRL